MPDIGRPSENGTDSFEIEGQYTGLPITMTESGTVSSFTARIWDTAGSSHTVRAVVWDSSGNIVDESSDRADIGTTEAEYVFTGFAGASLTATDYIVGLACSGGGGTVYLSGTDTATATDGRHENTPTLVPPTGVDDPTSFSNQSFLFDMFLTYTAAGGSSNLLQLDQAANGGF